MGILYRCMPSNDTPPKRTCGNVFEDNPFPWRPHHGNFELYGAGGPKWPIRQRADLKKAFFAEEVRHCCQQNRSESPSY